MMSKLLPAALTVVIALCLILAMVAEPVDGTAPVPSAPENPNLSTSMRLSALPALGSQARPLASWETSKMATPRRNVVTAAHTDFRSAALRQLAELNLSQLYKAVLQTIEEEELDDADFYDFVMAILETRVDYSPGDVLAALVEKAPTPELRMQALQLLAQTSQELSVDALSQALDDPDAAIRRSAAALLDTLSVNALLNAVATAVSDSNQDVRMSAFSTLEEMYQFAPVWEVAELVLNDPDPQTRMRALELLTYGEEPLAIEHLELALLDPNAEVTELAQALLTELEY